MPNLISPAVILSYPHLFKAVARKKVEPGKPNPPKYSASFLFTQEAMDSPETKAIMAAIEAAGVEKWGKTQFETMVKEGSFESPFKRDISAKGYPAHVVRYISSDSGEDYPPAVVTRFVDPETKKLAVAKPAEMYAGAIVRVSLSVRAYGGPGTGFKAGVKLDLRNVQKLADGERIAGGGAGDPSDDFGAGEAAQPATEEASLAGMLG